MSVFVVIGPPGAGKSSWVRDHAATVDLVADLDVIAAALTPDPVAHLTLDTKAGQHGNLVGRAALHALDAVWRTARRAGPEDPNAYVIHAIPAPEQVRRYLADGYHVLVVDPGRQTVIARAEAAGRLALVHNAIARWYDLAACLPERTVKVA